MPSARAARATLPPQSSSTPWSDAAAGALAQVAKPSWSSSARATSDG
ncbi:MAG TPA: hypothetical protein VMS55_14340 [Myxococcota bacterium]|nr:hypothetical protein [Myxococcota bacterium]